MQLFDVNVAHVEHEAARSDLAILVAPGGFAAGHSYDVSVAGSIDDNVGIVSLTARLVEDFDTHNLVALGDNVSEEGVVQGIDLAGFVDHLLANPLVQFTVVQRGIVARAVGLQSAHMGSGTTDSNQTIHQFLLSFSLAACGNDTKSFPRQG